MIRPSEALKGRHMNIRCETPADYAAVYRLVQTAFATAEHSDGKEQDLVAALRQSRSFVPALSLVAEIEGRLAGYILFTEIGIGNETALALAPLAVHPDFQRQGVGGRLIQCGHEAARALGYGACVVLGSAAYYSKFGYQEAAPLGILPPFEVPSENFMAVALADKALPQGIVAYDAAFFTV